MPLYCAEPQPVISPVSLSRSQWIYQRGNIKLFIHIIEFLTGNILHIFYIKIGQHKSLIRFNRPLFNFRFHKNLSSLSSSDTKRRKRICPYFKPEHLDSCHSVLISLFIIKLIAQHLFSAPKFSFFSALIIRVPSGLLSCVYCQYEEWPTPCG